MMQFVFGTCPFHSTHNHVYYHLSVKICNVGGMESSGPMYSTHMHTLLQWKGILHTFKTVTHHTISLVPNLWEMTNDMSGFIPVNTHKSPTYCLHYLLHTVKLPASRGAPLSLWTDQSHMYLCLDSRDEVLKCLTAIVPKRSSTIFSHCSMHCHAAQIVEYQEWNAGAFIAPLNTWWWPRNTQ
jgi:hypothetical protein